MDFDNGLTKAEAERLVLLMEECNEVSQRCAKILRHGWGSYHPFDENKVTNNIKLEVELGDLAVVLALMIDSGDLSDDRIEGFANLKKAKINDFLHFNKV